MEKDKLFDLWANRNPEWEIKYEDTIVKTFCDYGRGTTQLQDVRGKIFGGGYEILIVAFFIGLYNNQKKPLVTDTSKKKILGQPIKFWGNLDSKPGRVSYNNLMKYIFAALIARTDVDLIALDKGDISLRKVVDQLMDTMEQYINWGLDFMAEKMEDNPNYFFRDSAFLKVFMDLLPKKDLCEKIDIDSYSDEPESLD